MPPTCPPGLRLFQAAVQLDRGARLANAERLRDLHARQGSVLSGDRSIQDQVTIFCAHDENELAALR